MGNVNLGLVDGTVEFLSYNVQNLLILWSPKYSKENPGLTSKLGGLPVQCLFRIDQRRVQRTEEESISYDP
jgi:hypothetical protein